MFGGQFGFPCPLFGDAAADLLRFAFRLFALAFRLPLGFVVFAVFVQPARIPQRIQHRQRLGQIVAQVAGEGRSLAQLFAHFPTRRPRRRKGQQMLGRTQNALAQGGKRARYRTQLRAVAGQRGTGLNGQRAHGGRRTQYGCAISRHTAGIAQKRSLRIAARQRNGGIIGLNCHAHGRIQHGQLGQGGELCGYPAHRTHHAAGRLGGHGQGGQQGLPYGGGGGRQGGLGLIDGVFGGGHGVAQLLIDRPRRSGTVGRQTQSPFVIVQRPDQNRHIIGKFRTE